MQSKMDTYISPPPNDLMQKTGEGEMTYESAQKLKWQGCQVNKLASHPSPKRHFSLFYKCLQPEHESVPSL